MKASNSERWFLNSTDRWIIAGSVWFVIIFVAIGSDDGTVEVISFALAILTGIIVAPFQVLSGKRFVIVMAVLFILSCLVPPWRAVTRDRHPMGYGSVFNPPKENSGFPPTIYAQIDLGRLFLE